MNKYQKTWRNYKHKRDYFKVNYLLVGLNILLLAGTVGIYADAAGNRSDAEVGEATISQQAIVPITLPQSADPCTLDSVYCDNSIEGIITKSALKYGVNPDLMIKIAFCESSLNPLAVGDNGNSHGLWQIHKRYNKPELHAIAFDPVASSDWAAQRMAAGEYWRWTCAKKLGYL